MRPLSTLLRLARRAVVLAAAFVLVAATPALAAGPGGYGISPVTGTFVPLTTNNLIPIPFLSNGQMFYMSTTGTGLRRLPFGLQVYNQTYRNIAISSNGNIQLGVTSPGGNPTASQECIPTPPATMGPAIMPLWGELGYGLPGEGIFFRTQGSAPNRTFTISFQGHFDVSAPTEANAQVTFRENSQLILFTYGETSFQNLVTIGIQSKQQLSYTERYCSAHGQYPTNGTRLRLVHVD